MATFKLIDPLSFVARLELNAIEPPSIRARGCDPVAAAIGPDDWEVASVG
ncbi:MAG TPA: hypothetical protein VFS51_01430 [Gemmatimonadales bacterium]|nr:hypothetical protein [Gemmatimonadales bacterium]